VPVVSRKGKKGKKEISLLLNDAIERLAKQTIDCAFRTHVDLGPGLLESAYEAVLENRLRRLGLLVERQKPIPIAVDGLTLPDAFKADILIEGKLLLELKSVEKLTNLHMMQTLTYLRLTNLPLGLLINFNTEMFKDGIKRVMNNHAS
jgi:iron complex transport system substrate-binding protein